MRRMWRAGVILAAVVTLSQTSPASAADNAVIAWNKAFLQAVRDSRLGPPMVARALAIVHTCEFDAWASYDAVAVGTRLGGSLRRPAAEHTLANKDQAISYAAYRCISDMFPGQIASFDALMATLGLDPANTTTDTATPAGIGNVAAAAVLDYRHHDGSNQLGDLNPGAYSDYTGYVPVNTVDQVNDPNRWQPVRFSNGMGGFVVPGFLVPHWGLVTPFALGSSAEFRPPAPAPFGSEEYVRQARAVVQISARLHDREKVIGEYWADGPRSETPPGHWNLLAHFVSARDNHSVDDDVKLYFMLGNALMDASIATWECKRFYDYVRPITAIRYLFAGQLIRAWGGPYQGTQWIDGANWLPYTPPTFVTPPFPEYVSGHSTFSAASAEVLKLFTGSDYFGLAVTIAAGSSQIEPGAVPAEDIRLKWATFTRAADEAGVSRRYLGIHFWDGDYLARALGREVGQRVFEKSLTYIDGTAQ